MAQFRFIGDPQADGHGPESAELFGHVFTRSGWTIVTGEAAERCARHSHLECDEDGEPAREPKRRGRPPKVREA